MPLEPVAAEPPAIRGRVTATQHWRDLVFLHWRVAASALAPLLPEGTRPDEFDGDSWIGLIGFDLAEATLWGSPPVPFAGSFTEINVRLYAVDRHGRRGVVFRSLEASRLAAVLAARAAFSIPYFWSRTRHEVDGARHDFSASRWGSDATTSFAATSSTVPVDDELSRFVTARWALYTRRLGRTVRLENTHERWRLFEAKLEHLDDGLVAAAGIDVGGRPPDSVLYAPGVHARFGGSQRLE